ncbi:MAG: ribbon-helix-helix protein, CopG family [Alphaproteobacteria bacterium]|nr:ribbon-helix-helix protein, CopG family [Alphaproteobacteria bacterium]
MTKPTSIKLDPELKARVEQIAKAQGRTTHGVLREAVAEYVVKAEHRAELDRATLDAAAAFDATGVHVPGDEVDAWLTRLSAGENVPPPPARCG